MLPSIHSSPVRIQLLSLTSVEPGSRAEDVLAAKSKFEGFMAQTAPVRARPKACKPPCFSVGYILNTFASTSALKLLARPLAADLRAVDAFAPSGALVVEASISY